MAKIKILLVEQDEAYLMSLERILIEKLGAQMELMVITEAAYLEAFFEQPKQMDILIIHEALYREHMQRHNIRNTFFLTEEAPGAEATAELSKGKIYKYTSTGDIYRQIITTAQLEVEAIGEREEGLRVIAVYSPIGGSGKTTLATGLCQALADNGKQVLFLGADSLQTFGCFLEEPAFFNNTVEKQMTAKSSYIYSEVRKQIVHQGFDLLPVFPKVQPSFGVQTEHYLSLLDHIGEAGEYEYLVVDLATDFSPLTMAFLGRADNVLLVLEQSRSAAYKVERLLENMDCSHEGKFTCICNKYDASKENYLKEQEILRQCNLRAFIPKDEAMEHMNGAQLGRIPTIQELSILFM